MDHQHPTATAAPGTSRRRRPAVGLSAGTAREAHRLLQGLSTRPSHCLFISEPTSLHRARLAPPLGLPLRRSFAPSAEAGTSTARVERNRTEKTYLISRFYLPGLRAAALPPGRERGKTRLPPDLLNFAKKNFGLITFAILPPADRPTGNQLDSLCKCSLLFTSGPAARRSESSL